MGRISTSPEKEREGIGITSPEREREGTGIPGNNPLRVPSEPDTKSIPQREPVEKPMKEPVSV